MLLAPDRISGTVLLGLPGRDWLDAYEAKWLAQLQRGLVRSAGKVKLPFDIANLHADKKGRCLVGLASNGSSVVFLCPN